MDSTGNVYVADANNYTIRKVTPAGMVTTLAGLAGSHGSADGKGSDARFGAGDFHLQGPSGVAVDSTGNVYVADTYNFTIRKVTPTGVVTTLAGRAGNSGNGDGTGSDARFGGTSSGDRAGPSGVAVDTAGNVYVADTPNNTIRRVTPAGVVTTLAGLAGSFGSTDGTGSAVGFAYPQAAAVDSAGNIYVADRVNNTIRKGYPALAITSSGANLGFSGGKFGFNLTGPAGKQVVVEGSTDLMSWLPLWTNTFAGVLNFNDPQSVFSSSRFYRARTL